MTRTEQACFLLEMVEGKKSKPYRDSRDRWTAGVGATRDLQGNPITEHTPALTNAQIDQLLARDLGWAAGIVNHHVTVPLNDHEWSAIVSFTFNEGPGAAGVKDGLVTLRDGSESTLLRCLNAADMAGAGDQLLLWDKCEGKVLPGLLRRRRIERAVLLGHMILSPPPPQETMP